MTPHSYAHGFVNGSGFSDACKENKRLVLKLFLFLIVRTCIDGGMRFFLCCAICFNNWIGKLFPMLRFSSRMNDTSK